MDLSEIMIALILTLGAFANAQSQFCPVNWHDIKNITDNLDLEVTCGDTYIEVIVDTCILLNEGFLPATDLTIGPSGITTTCSDLQITSNIWTWIGRLNEPFSNCRTTETKDVAAGTITYSNAVALFQFSNTKMKTISRNAFVYLDFNCTYPYNYTNIGLQKSASHNISVVQDPQRGDEITASGEYTFTIQGCRENPCGTSEIQSGEEVTVLEDIYIIINTTRNISVHIYEVVAQDAESSPAETYTIINSLGCAVDSGASVDSSTLGEAILTLTAFQWANDIDKPVFFRISFAFCDPDLEGACAPPCLSPGRRRRSVLPHLSDQQSVATAILGPWTVV